MKYIYVDLGAYNGDTFLSFMANTDLPVAPEEFEIYLVEPNPAFTAILTKLADKFDNIKEVKSEAAWTDDGFIEFAQDTNLLAYGSTVMKAKENIWNTMPHIKVRCFDFSNWIKQFKNDYLIVKMDIEGAEFPILEKMIKDKTIKLINQLWVEMHPNKVREYTSIDSDDLIERVRKHTEVTLWH